MNEKDFFTFLDTQKQTVLDEIQSLTADGRKDEANILKAKSNVYDICKSIYSALAKEAPAHVATAFPETFDRITGPWKASLEAAKAHGDDRKILIEEAKLSAVSEITAKLSELS